MNDTKKTGANPSEGVVTPTTSPTGDTYGEKGIEQGSDSQTVTATPRSVESSIAGWTPRVK